MQLAREGVLIVWGVIAMWWASVKYKGVNIRLGCLSDGDIPVQGMKNIHSYAKLNLMQKGSFMVSIFCTQVSKQSSPP